MSDNVKWIGLGLLITVLFGSSPCCGNELFEEVKAGFAGVESRLENCSLQARYRVLSMKGGNEILETAIYSFDKGEYFSNTIFDAQSGLETVRAANDKYVFVVTKQKDSDKYALLEFLPRHSDDKKKQLKIDAGVAGIRMRLFRTHTIGSVWPAGILVRDPGFRVLSAESVNRNGQSCIKIAYAAEPKRALSEVTTSEPMVGYFICNPAANWAITEQWLKTKQSEEMGMLRIVLPKPTDFDIQVTDKSLSEYVAEVDIDAARKRLNSAKVTYPSLEYELLELLDAPEESLFFLSHYGLQEPRLKGFINQWVWYLLGAVVLAVAAVVFYRRMG